MIIVKYIFEDLTWYPSLTSKSKFLTVSVGIWRKVQMLKQSYCNRRLQYCEIFFDLIDHDLVWPINKTLFQMMWALRKWKVCPIMPWQNVLSGFPRQCVSAPGNFLYIAKYDLWSDLFVHAEYMIENRINHEQIWNQIVILPPTAWSWNRAVPDTIVGFITSSWRPFGPAWLRPSRPSGAQAVWPTPPSITG